MNTPEKTYSTSQLAQLFQLHPNTIRLYESAGYISKAERRKNNYRVFTQMHVDQMNICRCVYGYPFFNQGIRLASNDIMLASGRQDWKQAAIYTQNYLERIAAEIHVAKETAQILADWLSKRPPSKFGGSLSRKQLAAKLHITVEAVRNWERNGLLLPEAEVGASGETRYSSEMVQQAQIIYMLRQAGYSIAAIHKSLLSMTDDTATLLETNDLSDDPAAVGDRWQAELERLNAAGRKIPDLIEKLSKMKPSICTPPLN
ncbi:MerR family transcriptional regulator [Enterococcus sp. AZ109]|uniref:MerR family transcriptional regulator n=1 Tax=Enterococcus sp. AZ109 TaxID=2774634 RepID=UPI003F2150B1